MKNSINFTLLSILFLSFIFLISCTEEDPCLSTYCENGYCVSGLCECFAGYDGSQCQIKLTGSGGNDAALYGDWKREDGLAWIRASASEVLICAPEVTSEPQKCDWTGPGKLKCNLLGSIGDWEVELVGEQLKLIPITNASTNGPAFYNRDSEFYCDESGKGKITFYTTSDLGCGPITVTISGNNQVIDSYFPQGINDCDVSGCANFTLSPGSYSYQATCSGFTWNQTINITAGGCILYQLQ